MAPAGVLHTSPLPEHQYKIFLHLLDGGEKEVWFWEAEGF